jgi:uncharacterized membrane protein YfcA
MKIHEILANGACGGAGASFGYALTASDLRSAALYGASGLATGALAVWLFLRPSYTERRRRDEVGAGTQEVQQPMPNVPIRPTNPSTGRWWDPKGFDTG